MYSSHQDTPRLTLLPAAAFLVLVDTSSERIVGFPLGSSHAAMYSGRPIGVLATEEGVREVRFSREGKEVIRSPCVLRARSRRARSVEV